MRRPAWLSLLPLMLMLQAGCTPLKNGPADAVVVDRSAAPAKPQDDLEALRTRLALRSGEVARLRLQLLEKQAEINQAIAAHEQALEEVVRTNAELRSRDTRADAVARIAEAGLEIENARGRLGEEQQRTLDHADHLLQSSRVELDQGNYSGASYLADKAIGLVTPLRALPETDSNIAREEETKFATPLEMQARKQSNVREKPERGSRVLFQLNKAQEVRAHAYSGRWIRISSDLGEEGWVYYHLLELVIP